MAPQPPWQEPGAGWGRERGRSRGRCPRGSSGGINENSLENLASPGRGCPGQWESAALAGSGKGWSWHWGGRAGGTVPACLSLPEPRLEGMQPKSEFPSREQWLSAPRELSGLSQPPSLGKRKVCSAGASTFPGFGLQAVAA